MDLWTKNRLPLKPGDHVLIPALVIACGENFCELEYWPRGNFKGLMNPQEIYRANVGDPPPDNSSNTPDSIALADAVKKEILSLEYRITELRERQRKTT